MAEYIRYKGERYKKIDASENETHNEKSERVDTLEQRIQTAIDKLYILYKSDPKINLNGNRIKYKIFDKNRIAFVCDNIIYDKDEKNNHLTLSTKLLPKVITCLRASHITTYQVKVTPKSDGKYKFVVSGKINKP